MATTISGMISFSGFLGDTKYTEPADGRKARLSVKVYDRRSWKDAQGRRRQSETYDSITVVYWGRTAQAVHQLIADRTIGQKDPVTGTGYLDDEPDAWIGRDDQQAHARIRVDGRSLCPDPLRRSFIDQAASRKQEPAPQTASGYSQQPAPAESWPKTARPGAQAAAQQQRPAANGPAGAQPDWMR